MEKLDGGEKPDNKDFTYITNINTKPDAGKLGEDTQDVKMEEDEETTSKEAVLKIYIFRFKQKSVTDFFRSTEVIEWDEEVRKLKREYRLEIKRSGEQEEGEERRRILQKVAMESRISPWYVCSLLWTIHTSSSWSSFSTTDHHH